MTHNGEIIITKNPSTYLKKACTISKPNEQIDYYERVASKASFFSVVVEDVAEDENGKVSIVVLKLNYKLGSDEQLKYAEIFFRDKKECLKRREGFKKWLEEDYAKYKARQSKYE